MLYYFREIFVGRTIDENRFRFVEFQAVVNNKGSTKIDKA